MKRRQLALAMFGAFAMGCWGCKHSGTDVTPPSGIAKQSVKHGSSDGFIDLKKLPPGAVRHTIYYKKGDILPDGTVADADRTVVKIEVMGRSVRPEQAKSGPQ